MVIPNTVEARVQVSLILGHYNGGDGYHVRSGLRRGGGYHVSGYIKARAKEMKNWSV